MPVSLGVPYLRIRLWSGCELPRRRGAVDGVLVLSPWGLQQP